MGRTVLEGVLQEAALCVAYAPVASMDRSALWLTFPPRYTNSFVRLYTWPVVSSLDMAVDSDIPLGYVQFRK